MSSDSEDAMDTAPVQRAEKGGRSSNSETMDTTTTNRLHSSSSIWNPQKARKRRRSQLCRNMKQLKIPSTLNEIHQQEDAYEWDAESFLESTLWRIPRPLPAMASMATQPPPGSTSSDKQDFSKLQRQREQRGLSMPLLVSFQSALRDKQEENNTDEQANNIQEGVEESSVTVVPMEDASLSILSEGQHRRFLQLQQEQESRIKWNEAKRKEYKKLLNVVKQEQALYHKAVETYVEQHLQLFLVGFDKNKSSPFSSAVALLNAKRVAQYQELWRSSNKALTFGKCTQTISLPSLGEGTTHKQRKVTHLESLIVENKVVHTSSVGGNSLPVVDSDRFKTDTNVPLSNITMDDSDMPTAAFLRDDAVAQELAKQYNVDIVTGKDTLQALLQLPGEVSTKWMVPLFATNRTKALSRTGNPTVVWLESPIPQPSTPRQCLTRGYETVLYQALSHSNNDEKKDKRAASTSTRCNTQYFYTLLTLGKTIAGPASRHLQSVKVLVKSMNRLVLDDKATPLCLHAHLDYFMDRKEEFTSTQRASWILDKVLQPLCRVMVGRTCPHSCQLKQWEETSVAHALAQSGSTSKSIQEQAHGTTAAGDPMNHWIAMVQLLNSMPMMEQGEQLLCLPGRNVPSNAMTCVSVHHKTDQQHPVIDLQQELQQANAVYTGEIALKQCFQQWMWQDHGRIPFTFPLKKHQDRKQGS